MGSPLLAPGLWPGRISWRTFRLIALHTIPTQIGSQHFPDCMLNFFNTDHTTTWHSEYFPYSPCSTILVYCAFHPATQPAPRRMPGLPNCAPPIMLSLWAGSIPYPSIFIFIFIIFVSLLLCISCDVLTYLYCLLFFLTWPSCSSLPCLARDSPVPTVSSVQDPR